jgi:glutamyl-tRNA synthetase
MIVNNQGKPYSKRDGAAFVGDFREQGFLGDALFNFLALLGWSPGDDLELMSKDQMIELFSLDRVKSGAARFDTKKLTWMNGEYMREVPREVFTPKFIEELRKGGICLDPLDQAYIDAICEHMHSRTKVYSDVVPANSYFFIDDYPVDEKAYRKRLAKPGVPALLDGVRGCFEALETFDAESTEAALNAYCEANEIGLGQAVHPVRVSVSGLAAGPGLFDMLALIGKTRVVERMARAAEQLRAEGIE